MSAVANPTPALLHAFIDKDESKELKDRNSLDMREAYSWNRDEIIDWLGKVANDPVVWGQPEPKVKPMLKELAVWIEALSLPAGKEYDANDFWPRKPSQHISRKYIANWSSKDLDKSKFSVQGFVSDDGIYLFNQYDMLGRFLGLLGPANPGQANKGNFYLPLTAMYAQWCSELGTKTWPNGRTSGGALPAMFQCTWDVKSGNYRLGAALGGHSAAEFATGTWLEVIRDARCAVLTEIRKDLFHFDVKRGFEPVEKGKEKEEQTPWGNCAETYPFIEMFRSETTYNRDYICGLALNRKFLFDQNAARMAGEAGTRKFYDDARYGYVYEYQDGPCINCRTLINRARGVKADFYYYGKSHGDTLFPDRRKQRAIEQKAKEDAAAAAKMEKEMKDEQAAQNKVNAWTKQ